MTLHQNRTQFSYFYSNRFIFKAMEFTEEGSLLNSKVKLRTVEKGQRCAVNSQGTPNTGEK